MAPTNIGIINTTDEYLLDGSGLNYKYKSMKSGDMVMVVKHDAALTDAFPLFPKSVVRDEERRHHKNFYLVLSGTGVYYVARQCLTLVAPGNTLKDKNFVFTGTLEYSREFYVALVEAYGGKVKPAITKEVNYLVAQNSRGISSKLRKAKSYGTKVLEEKEFWAVVKEHNSV